MIRADAHAHLSAKSGFSEVLGGGDEVAIYLSLRQRAGISETLVVGYDRGTHAGNSEEILGLARTHPGLYPAAFLETRARPAMELIAEGIERGYAGWSMYLDDTGLDEWRSSDRSAWGTLSTGVLSVNVAAENTASLSRVLAATGDIPILVSHVGLPGARPPRAALAALAALSNDPRLHIKISGLYAIDPLPGHPGAREAVRMIADEFGTDRLLWGSDFSPVCDAGADPAEIAPWLSPIAGDGLQAILGGTLRRLLTRH